MKKVWLVEKYDEGMQRMEPVAVVSSEERARALCRPFKEAMYTEMEIDQIYLEGIGSQPHFHWEIRNDK